MCGLWLTTASVSVLLRRHRLSCGLLWFQLVYFCVNILFFNLCLLLCSLVCMHVCVCIWTCVNSDNCAPRWGYALWWSSYDLHSGSNDWVGCIAGYTGDVFTRIRFSTLLSSINIQHEHVSRMHECSYLNAYFFQLYHGQCACVPVLWLCIGF